MTQIDETRLPGIGVRYTFGIPGVHNTEIYDELNRSSQIQPVLVTHEGGATFMADAVSRVSDSVGVLVVVPAGILGIVFAGPGAMTAAWLWAGAGIYVAASFAALHQADRDSEKNILNQELIADK